MNATSARRRRADRRAAWAAGACLLVLVTPMLGMLAMSILEALRLRGYDAWLWAATASSLELLVAALAIGVPVGVLSGVHVAELASPAVAGRVRLLVDVLAGTPPLLFGVLVHSVVVVMAGELALVPAALALGLLVAPPVARATEELLALVPVSLREAALGLGLPPWRVALFVSLRSLAPSLRGVGFAVGARALGEAAPLLFTASVTRGLTSSLLGGEGGLALGIHAALSSAEPIEQGRAWAACSALLVVVLFGSALGRARGSRP